MIAPAKIPVFRTAGAALGFLWRAKGSLLGLVAFVAILTHPVFLFPLPVYVPQAIAFVFAVLFAVAWQRRFLFDGERLGLWSAIGWDLRKTKAAAPALLILAVAGGLLFALRTAMELFLLPPAATGNSAIALVWPYAAAVTGGGIGHIALAVAAAALLAAFVHLLVFTLVGARLFLMLPAVASDQGFSPSRAWNWSKGNGFRIAFAAMLAAFPFHVAQLALGDLARWSETNLDLLLCRLGYAVFALLALAAGSGALAVCYATIREDLAMQASAASPDAQQPGLRLGGAG